MTAATTTPLARLSGLHLLLTYECNFECDHCFVWGGSTQNGTMTAGTLERILQQADDLGTVEWIYFEGGEAFLHYDLLKLGARRAKERGFRVGMVSNAYWAATDAEAMRWLRPFAGLVEDLSISDDDYHGSRDGAGQTRMARRAAERLGIPVDFISVAGPGPAEAHESTVMFRGRAAERLAPRAPMEPWQEFTRCPWEDLRHPQRVHVDAYGNLHVCQGISIGNLLQRPLAEIMRDYDPDAHPVVGPLLAGGPAALIERYGLPHRQGYADACHLCYAARCQLRERFPGALTPEQMYGSLTG